MVVRARANLSFPLGRVLTPEDIAHYQRVVVALKETMRLMEEIDAVIDGHGGGADRVNMVSTKPSEAQLLEQYWHAVGGRIYTEVQIGSNVLGI